MFLCGLVSCPYLKHVIQMIIGAISFFIAQILYLKLFFLILQNNKDI